MQGPPGRQHEGDAAGPAGGSAAVGQAPHHGRWFPTTHWTLVESAGSASDAERRAALGGLLARYLAPMRAYLIVSKRVAPDRADDLLQAFVADKVLEQGLLRRAERGRGRF